MKIGVIGTGHVGLITSISLAAVGHDVVGADADADKIERLREGQMPFFEPGVADLLHEEMSRGCLRFTTDTREAVRDAEAVFICVGTPPRATGEANLVAVEQAARDVARAATGPVAVIDKSTVPAGTAERVLKTLRLERPDLADGLDVVSNPEFLREGKALRDALEPTRILVGARSERGRDVMRRVYAPFIERGAPYIETDIATAELAKHASNAFLAMKISYANALARICERIGADVEAVADVMGADPRIGRAFLGAGLGYGGYCFPKDLVAFDALARRVGYEFGLLREVARINDEAVQAVVERLGDAVRGLTGSRVAILGLSFKPETDDVRLSPALALASRLLELGAEVVGFDPRSGANAKAELPGLRIATDPYDAAAGADAVVLATDWAEFRDLDLARLRNAVAAPVFVDARNAMDGRALAGAGFVYVPVGKRPLRPEG